MELTPELFETVAFRERWRGYDPDEVDEFLERVGAAVTGLFDLVRDAEARAGEAATQADEHREVDEAMRSMLLLAHRTAETAVAEARAEADRIVADAHEAAARTVADAAEAAEAHRVEGLAGLAAEVAELTRQRDTLVREIEVLQLRRDEERELMRRELQNRLAELERPISVDPRPDPEPDPEPDPDPRRGAPSAAGAVVKTAAEPEDVEGPPTVMLSAVGDAGSGPSSDPGSDPDGRDNEAMGVLDDVFDDDVIDVRTTDTHSWSALRSVPQRH